MAVTRPWVTCHRYSIPLFRSRPPGLHEPYKRKGKESIKQSCRVHARTNPKVLLPVITAQGDLSADLAHGKTPPPIDCDREVVKPVPTPFILGWDPKKYWSMEKRREETEGRNAQLITFLRCRVPKLLTHFLHSRVSDLNSCLTPLPNAYSIRPTIQHRTCSSYHLGVGLCRNRQGGGASAYDLASMGASADIGRSHQLNTSIVKSHLLHWHLASELL